MGEISFNGVQTDAVRRILREREQKPIQESNDYYKLAKFFYNVKNIKKASIAYDTCLKLNPYYKKCQKLKIKITVRL